MQCDNMEVETTGATCRSDSAKNIKRFRAKSSKSQILNLPHLKPSNDVRSVREGEQVVFLNKAGEILVGNVEFRKSLIEVCLKNSNGNKLIVRDLEIPKKVGSLVNKQKVLYVTGLESCFPETEGFSILDTGEVIEICNESIWICPSDNSFSLKISIEDICEISPGMVKMSETVASKPTCNIKSKSNIVSEQVHVVSDEEAIHKLHSLVNEFSISLLETQEAYSQDLLALSLENISDKDELSALHIKYREVLVEYQQVKFKLGEVIHKGNIREHALLNEINKKNDEILKFSTDLWSLRNKFKECEAKYEEELTKAKARIVELENELAAVKEQCNKLTDENRNSVKIMKDLEDNITQLKAKAHLEKICGDKDQFVARTSNSVKRGTTYHKVVRPDVASSNASQKSLEQRAYALKHFLDLISAKGVATHHDTVCTLSKFANIYKDIFIEAGEKAGILVSQVLSPHDSLDLKLLLRLPMKRLRELRTFLQAHHINILASDAKIYKEAESRTDSDDQIEVGIVLMLKNASAKEPSRVAYVRRHNLEYILQSAYDTHLTNGNISSHEGFRGEVWVLIGGDKGGTSSKFCLQVANVMNSSSDNIELISTFEAFDSYENMDKIFGVYTDQVRKMQQDDYSVRISPLQASDTVVSRRVRTFIYGDYCFLCVVLGHQGAASKYPCLWCDICKDQLAKSKPHCSMVLNDDTQCWQNNPNWVAKLRSPASFEENYIAYNESSKKIGKNHGNITKPMILPIVSSVYQIVPMPLHILLGLILKFYNMLETDCREIDRKIYLLSENAELHENWVLSSQKAEETNSNYEEAKVTYESAELLLSSFKTTLKKNKSKRARLSRKDDEDKCDHPICAIYGGFVTNKDQLDWVQCSRCDSWFHTVCVEFVEGVEDYVCCSCHGGSILTEEDVIDAQVENVSIAKSMFTLCKEENLAAKSHLEDLFNAVKENKGPLENKLTDVLEHDLGVRRQAYHSNSFVGNHISIILAQHAKLIEVLKVQDPDLHFKYLKLFSIMNNIKMKMAARFLNDEEINDLKLQCYELGTWFPVAFPDQSITPKFHILVVHVPEFVSKWHTLGLLGEHGIESIHCKINNLHRVYAGIRDRERHLKLVFREHALRKTASKICGIKRVCDNCWDCVNQVNTINKSKKRGRFKKGKCQVCDKT